MLLLDNECIYTYIMLYHMRVGIRTDEFLGCMYVLNEWITLTQCTFVVYASMHGKHQIGPLDNHFHPIFRVNPNE
jgi:hypothetical protein